MLNYALIQLAAARHRYRDYRGHRVPVAPWILPAWVKEHIVTFLPDVKGNSLSGINKVDVPQYLRRGLS